jgi:hypothetical protein
MDIIKLSLASSGDFEITINAILIAVSLAVLIVWVIIRLRFQGKHYSEFEIDEAVIGIGNHKIKIKPNDEDLQIAYQLWVELSTRKIGISIDEQNDVIVELYNSWYDFFQISREHIKSIPVRKVRANTSTKEIVDLSFKILNACIRPHLTLWQAKFRRWYEGEIVKDENQGISPQDIQRKYPEYKGLMEDLMRVNQVLISYKEMLEKLIHVR